MSQPQPNILIDNANKVLREQARDRVIKALEKRVNELEKRVAILEARTDTKKS